MNILNVACIGTGLVGQGWATLFALKGLSVNVMDLDKKVVDRILNDVKTNLSVLSNNDVISEDNVSEAVERITVHDRLSEAVEEVEYVQESVYENIELKKRIFSEIEENASKDTIIASSTSALSISEIQKSVKRPQRCLIAHPINPVYIIPLVEIVPGSKTSKATVDITCDLMSNLGKTPLICKKEVPGFIVNRLQSAVYREAFDLIGNNVATIEDVEKAVTAGLGLRWAFMGPFLVMHLAGGKGGIEYRLEHLRESQRIRWESMASWTSIPEVAERKAVQEIKEYRFLKGKSYEKIRDWRDEKLIKLLNFFNTI